MKKKRRLPLITAPSPVVGVEIAYARICHLRASLFTEVLELENAPEEAVAEAIAITRDLRNRFLYTERLRVN